MKKIALMCAMLSIMNIACAQQINRRTPEERAAHKTAVLKRKLKLNLAQEEQVKQVLLTQANSVDSLRNTNQDHRKGMRLSRKRITDLTNQKMSGILNPEQLKTFEDWKAAKKAKHLASKRNAG